MDGKEGVEGMLIRRTHALALGTLLTLALVHPVEAARVAGGGFTKGVMSADPGLTLACQGEDYDLDSTNFAGALVDTTGLHALANAQWTAVMASTECDTVSVGAGAVDELIFSGGCSGTMVGIYSRHGLIMTLEVDGTFTCGPISATGTMDFDLIALPASVGDITSQNVTDEVWMGPWTFMGND
jgi:hypothetical protein